MPSQTRLLVLSLSLPKATRATTPLRLPIPAIHPGQPFSSARRRRGWEGRQADENPTREKDKHNVQHDAVKEGKDERAKGEGSVGTSEKGGDANKKAERDNTEAPKPVIGMNDERGSECGDLEREVWEIGGEDRG
ncbi:hypothetical protein D0Z07_0027 [Hyphodiscus hymeniophilus]|uniref:Uncharacterized protein n=1 Tax=Hyphodiscus hymeniophilus TaxID=353542 RepID=A0A9P6VRY2_9HELO|nr:hypothetical protein D0Z07_0027 [Hyphodiscus hymeniophilus]